MMSDLLNSQKGQLQDPDQHVALLKSRRKLKVQLKAVEVKRNVQQKTIIA